jgi:hypothetical protein
MKYVAMVANVLPDAQAQDLLARSNIKNIEQSFNDQQLGIISGGLGRLLAHKELGPKIQALSNGSATEREAIWNNVLWPYIMTTSVSYNSDGQVDIGATIQAAISDKGALASLLKDVPAPVPVNPKNAALGTTIDRRWQRPEVRTALAQITNMYGGKTGVPVITTNAEGKQVMRLAGSWGSSAHVKDQLGNYVEVEIK